ncbi:actin-depolymerizing factor 7, partial [Quercus suber]
ANAASGMAVRDECKLKFLELKAKRNLEAQMKPEDFAESLPANGCMLSMICISSLMRIARKARFFSLHGHLDTSKVRSKVIYTTSKYRFKKDLHLVANQVELRVTNPSKMSLDIVKGQALCHFTRLMFSFS